MLSATIVVGNDDAKNAQQRIDSQGNVDNYSFYDDDCSRVVPGYDIGLGFVYESCFCQMAYKIKVGWEFVSWFNIATPRIFPSDGQYTTPPPARRVISTSPDTATLGFNGLTVGLELSY